MSDAEPWREEIARIIDPSAFKKSTPHHNRVFRNDSLEEAKADALAKADAIILAATAQLSAERDELLDLRPGRDLSNQVVEIINEEINARGPNQYGTAVIAAGRILDLLRRARELVGE